jgi:hypothetical protein
MRSLRICGVCGSATVGEAALGFLTPHILLASEGGQEFIDHGNFGAYRKSHRTFLEALWLTL